MMEMEAMRQIKTKKHADVVGPKWKILKTI
jgi:hypothetical protein